MSDTSHPCKGCEKAAADPRSHFFGTPDCKECCARSLAQSPAYFEAARARTISGTYKAALRYFFGDESLTAGHTRVEAWADRIAAATLEATTPEAEKLRADLAGLELAPSSITTKAGA